MEQNKQPTKATFDFGVKTLFYLKETRKELLQGFYIMYIKNMMSVYHGVQDLSSCKTREVAAQNILGGLRLCSLS